MKEMVMIASSRTDYILERVHGLQAAPNYSEAIKQRAKDIYLAIHQGIAYPVIEESYMRLQCAMVDEILNKG